MRKQAGFLIIIFKLNGMEYTKIVATAWGALPTYPFGLPQLLPPGFFLRFHCRLAPHPWLAPTPSSSWCQAKATQAAALLEGVVPAPPSAKVVLKGWQPVPASLEVQQS